MNNIPDGGPAFPVTDTVHPDGQVQYGFNGMSLRDYFAAHAMQALLTRGYMQDDAAKRAYNTADSMLKQREQESK